MERELEVIFAREHLRLTIPRKTVFDAMHGNDTPEPASAIAKQCGGIDRTSVYRTLELFVRLGIAQTVPLGWKQRYELTGPFKSHHHHLSCTKCGRLVDVHSEQFEQVVTNIATRYGFTPESHTFEIRGLCGKCR